MKKRLFTVKNKAGIHCRPSGVILNTITGKFPGHRFFITFNGETVEINSMLALISIGLTCGSTGELSVDGESGEDALQCIGDLLEYEFDFPPR